MCVQLRYIVGCLCFPFSVFIRVVYSGMGTSTHLVFAALHLDGPGSGLQLDENDPEVGAPEVQGEKLSILPARRQLVDVRNVALHVRRRVCLLSQAAVYLKNKTK